jgi:hypothetical protein
MSTIDQTLPASDPVGGDRPDTTLHREGALQRQDLTTPNTILPALLDHVGARLDHGDGVPAVHLLCDELQRIYLSVPAPVWQEELVPLCRRHRLHTLLFKDPYTPRAYQKPRGYSGDAEMLDFIYTVVQPAQVSGVGRQVFEVTTGGPTARSVRERRDLLAAEIDRTSASTPTPLILSVACGHLREAQQSTAIRPGWPGTFYALDQDEQSLAVVQREQGMNNVRTIHRSAGAVLRGELGLGGLSLVYASGLFDYLGPALAARLAGSMFSLLGPGGRLLIANFTPDTHGRAYMEAFMDWNLIYRDEADMRDIAAAMPAQQVAQRRLFRDSERNVVYLEVFRQA